MTVFKKIFDEALKETKVDDKLFHQIRHYVNAFINKNDDHIKFFGSNLTGVYPVRFKSEDKNRWNDELLNIDEYSVRQAIINPEHGAVPEEWVRATDVMNISCLYLSYRFFNSSMNQKLKQDAIVNTLMALHCKLISSLMAHFFPYPADEATAMATYAALSKKYSIKQQGSWRGVLLNRCMDIIDEQSIHYQTIRNFNDDDAIIYMIQDIQGRLRDIIKKLWKVFELVRTQNAKILTNSGTVELDGKIMVRDMERALTPYKIYINKAVLDKSSFIKRELVDVIAKAVHTAPEPLIYSALEYISDNYIKDKNIVEFVDNVVIHVFGLLATDENMMNKLDNLAGMLETMKFLYMASKSSDPLILNMRKSGEKIIKKATSSKNPSTLSSVRTATMLYIVARTFAKKYYG